MAEAKRPRKPLFFVMSDVEDDVDEYHDREHAILECDARAEKEAAYPKSRVAKVWVVEAIHVATVKRNP